MITLDRVHLTEDDKSLLGGEGGEAARIAMELLVKTAEAMAAPRLLDVSGAHIDGCLYHGRAGLDFARSLADAGGRVVVPTTLNVSSLDLLHPALYRGDPGEAALARELMTSYEEMGCRPTWTCAPYQLPERPAFGEQIAWGESNAIVFANSVLGARTNRYGDFLDICCALTGRAPDVGLHTDDGRRATLAVDVDVPDDWKDDDLLYVAVGLALGQIAGTEVAVLTGLDVRADEDRLKTIGAAAASSGAVGMFHVAGVTPEAETLGSTPNRNVSVTGDQLLSVLRSIGGQGRLGAVSLGTPHASVREMEELAALCNGRQARVPFFVNTGRDVAATVPGSLMSIEDFGGTVVTDTCTYLTPILGEVDGVVMTNSGKWAYYAPANIGVGVAFGNTRDCVESAVRGEIVNTGILG